MSSPEIIPSNEAQWIFVDVTPWQPNPVWLVPLFPIFWLFITGLLAHMGGWVNLAERYATEKPAEGARFRFVSGSMGKSLFPVSYGNCLCVTVDAQGFRLSILFPFRFMSPPLYLPWKDVAEVTDEQYLFMQVVHLRVKDHWPRITLRGSAGEAVLRAYRRSTHTAGLRK